MRFFLALFAFILSFNLLEANSVRLVNDSPYKLRAVIRGSDGSYLGEVIINATESQSWNDNYLLGDVSKNRPSRSQTPYSILWYCMDGSDYGINTNVGTGFSAAAQGSEGSRICAAPKPPEPHQNEKEGLQPNQERILPRNSAQ